MLLKGARGPGETAHLVKGLLHKPGDLRSDPQDRCKAQTQEWKLAQPRVPMWGNERQRQENCQNPGSRLSWLMYMGRGSVSSTTKSKCQDPKLFSDTT